MTRRIRIPLLLDLLIVDDAAQIAALDADPAIGRTFAGSKSRIVRWLGGRLRRLLSVGNTPYPALLPREDRIRAAQTAMLEKRLGTRGENAEIPAETVRLLARYVRGEASEATILKPLQQLIGGQFSPRYIATNDSIGDALTLGAAARNPLRGLWLWLTRRLRPTQRRIGKVCDGDIYAAHGTVVGFQSLLTELRKLREHFTVAGSRESADVVIARLIAPPPRTLRAATGPVHLSTLNAPVDARTLIVFAPSGRGANAAFAVGRWSQCPAHGFVLRLLEEAWRAAVPSSTQAVELTHASSRQPIDHAHAHG
jgi:hypothetical protein